MFPFVRLKFLRAINQNSIKQDFEIFFCIIQHDGIEEKGYGTNGRSLQTNMSNMSPNIFCWKNRSWSFVPKYFQTYFTQIPFCLLSLFYHPVLAPETWLLWPCYLISWSSFFFRHNSLLSLFLGEPSPFSFKKKVNLISSWIWVKTQKLKKKIFEHIVYKRNQP